MLLPWVLCAVLSVVVAMLLLKIYLLKKSMDEICTQMEEHLASNTNRIISISSSDKTVKHLAAKINHQLHLLRKKHHQYKHGSLELNEAIVNISHDLRTPLTAICGYLNLTQKEDKSENLTRYLFFIRERTESLIRLTEELFRYSVVLSAQEEFQVQEVNMNSLLEEVLAAHYAVLTGQGIVPTISITEQPVICEVNRDATSRIFSNIISNAIKYGLGDLEVVMGSDGIITFSNKSDNLNEIQVGKLFNRFFTVEDGHNSTGLGLTIAKTLTEKMGGEIKANYITNTLSVSLSFPLREERAI